MRQYPKCPIFIHPGHMPVPETFSFLSWEPGRSPAYAHFHLPSLLSSVEAIAAKMRFHSQLFSQDWEDSTFSVMERKVGSPLLHTSYLYWSTWGKPIQGDRGGDLIVVMSSTYL